MQIYLDIFAFKRAVDAAAILAALSVFLLHIFF
jgi:hypothetical protein